MGHKTVFPWDPASKQRAENFYVLAEEFVVVVVVLVLLFYVVAFIQSRP